MFLRNIGDGRVYYPVAMFGRPIDRVEPEELLSGIFQIVPRACRDNDAGSRLDLARGGHHRLVFRQ